MLNLLGFVIPWWGRWAMIAALFAATAGWGAVKMHEHDERAMQARELAWQKAADEQNARSAARAAHDRQLKEASDAYWKTLNDRAVLERDTALARLHDAAGRRLVPAAPAGAAGSGRICFAADELDRRLRAAVERLQQRALANAAAGQRAVDVAQTCNRWAMGLAEKGK